MIDPAAQNPVTHSPNLLSTSTVRGQKYASIYDNFLKNDISSAKELLLMRYFIKPVKQGKSPTVVGDTTWL